MDEPTEEPVISVSGDGLSQPGVAAALASGENPLPPDRSPSAGPWTFGDLGFFLLFALGTMVLVFGTVLGGVSLLSKVFGWGLSVNDAAVQTPVAVLTQILWEVFWVLCIYYVVVSKYGLNFWQGLRWAPAVERSGVYLFAGFVLSIAIQLSSSLFPEREEMPIERLFDTPSSAYLLALFGICVAPFVEELVFRGFFYPVLERRWGSAAAVGITGTLFAALHAQQVGGIGPELLAILAVGLILSAVRAVTGSVKNSFLVHLSYNSTLFILLFLATNRFQTLPN